MTVGEALKIEQNWTAVQARNDLERLLLTGERPANKVIAMGVKALEKQMPKKITHEASLYECCTCPKCKNVVDKFERFGDSMVRVKYNYCHFCGQALDWSDTE